jgi:hypothetical protein
MRTTSSRVSAWFTAGPILKKKCRFYRRSRFRKSALDFAPSVGLEHCDPRRNADRIARHLRHRRARVLPRSRAAARRRRQSGDAVFGTERRHARAGGDMAPRSGDLAQSGIEVLADDYSLRERGIPNDRLQPGVSIRPRCRDRPAGRGCQGNLALGGRHGRRKNAYIPKATIGNAITALREAPEWRNILCFDEFRQKVVLRGKALWMQHATEADWTDNFDTKTAAWLQEHDIDVTPSAVTPAIDDIARENTFHPVREYLESLVPNGRNLLDMWLLYFLGVEPDPVDETLTGADRKQDQRRHEAQAAYIRAVGRAWLISAVARVFRPDGCGRLSAAVPFTAGPRFRICLPPAESPCRREGAVHSIARFAYRREPLSDLSFDFGIRLVVPRPSLRQHPLVPFARAGPRVRIRFAPAESPLRTSFLAREDAGRSETEARFPHILLTGDRGFESISLQRGVSCEPDFSGVALSAAPSPETSNEAVSTIRFLHPATNALDNR